jgi:hypothetical protein
MKPSSPLSETPLSTGNYFQFEFDKDYQRLQIQFLDYVDQHDLQGIMVCSFSKKKTKFRLNIFLECSS